MKNRAIWYRFQFALNGLKESFLSEKSVRAHVIAIIAALILWIAVSPPPLWWALFALTAGMMLAAELVNTAVEKLVDHLHPGLHTSIKVVKDTLAGAVLVSCLAGGAVVLALLWTHW